MQGFMKRVKTGEQAANDVGKLYACSMVMLQKRVVQLLDLFHYKLAPLRPSYRRVRLSFQSYFIINWPLFTILQKKKAQL